MSEDSKPRTIARRILIEETKAEINDEKIHNQKHENDLAERLFSDWPAYAGLGNHGTKYGPVTGSTYGGGGGLWRGRYYWVVIWLSLCFIALFVVVLVILLLSGRVSF